MSGALPFEWRPIQRHSTGKAPLNAKAARRQRAAKIGFGVSEAPLTKDAKALAAKAVAAL